MGCVLRARVPETAIDIHRYAGRSEDDVRGAAELRYRPPAQPEAKTATVKLQEKILASQKKAEELGLKDADALKEINKELDKLVGKDMADRKDALIKINDLAKEIDKRKQDVPMLVGGRHDRSQHAVRGPAQHMQTYYSDQNRLHVSLRGQVG